MTGTDPMGQAADPSPVWPGQVSGTGRDRSPERMGTVSHPYGVRPVPADLPPVVGDVIALLVSELGAVDVTTTEMPFDTLAQINAVIEHNQRVARPRPPTARTRPHVNPEPRRFIDMTMDNGFAVSAPAAPGAGSGFSQSDIEGHLVVIINPTLQRNVMTQNGPRDVCDALLVVDLDTGDEWYDARFFGTVLVPQLTSGADIVSGLLGKGTAAPGKNAPWTMHAPQPDQLARANTWILEQVNTGRIARNASGDIVLMGAAQRDNTIVAQLPQSTAPAQQAPAQQLQQQVPVQQVPVGHPQQQPTQDPVKKF